MAAGWKAVNGAGKNVGREAGKNDGTEIGHDDDLEAGHDDDLEAGDDDPEAGHDDDHEAGHNELLQALMNPGLEAGNDYSSEAVRKRKPDRSTSPGKRSRQKSEEYMSSSSLSNFSMTPLHSESPSPLAGNSSTPANDVLSDPQQASLSSQRMELPPTVVNNGTPTNDQQAFWSSSETQSSPTPTNNQQTSSSSPRTEPPPNTKNTGVPSRKQQASSVDRKKLPSYRAANVGLPSSNRSTSASNLTMRPSPMFTNVELPPLNPPAPMSGPRIPPIPTDGFTTPNYQQRSAPVSHPYPGSPSDSGPSYQQQGPPSVPSIHSGHPHNTGFPNHQQAPASVPNMYSGSRNNSGPSYQQQRFASDAMIHPSHSVYGGSYNQQGLDHNQQRRPSNNIGPPYDHPSNTLSIGLSPPLLIKKADFWEFFTSDKFYLASINGELLCKRLSYFSRFDGSTGEIPLADISWDYVTLLIQWAKDGSFPLLASNLDSRDLISELNKRYRLYRFAEQIRQPELADSTMTAIIYENSSRGEYPCPELAKLAYMCEDGSRLRKFTCLAANWIIQLLPKEKHVSLGIDSLIKVHPDLIRDFVWSLGIIPGDRRSGDRRSDMIDPYELPVCHFHMHQGGAQCERKGFNGRGERLR